MARTKRKLAELASPSITDHDTEGAASDEDQQSIQADCVECLFQVESLQQPTTASSSSSSSQKMENVFIVRPTTIWDSMTRYTNFIVNDEQLTFHDNVHILRSTHADSNPNDTNSSLWIARVLEIRAHSPAHVYLRVFWLYRPADLPDGEQGYHGSQELIASNNMTIVDASAVVGRADVKHWDEDTEDLPPEGLFWRQTMDMSTRKLSPPKPHCTCLQPLNPSSTPLLRCPHCSIRLHEPCIIDAALATLYERAASGGDTIVVAPATGSKRKTKKQTAKKKKDGWVEVEVIIEGGGDQGGGAKLLISDKRGERPERWEEGVVCLACRRPL